MGVIWALCDFGRRRIQMGRRGKLGDHSIGFYSIWDFYYIVMESFCYEMTLL
jgi:hypothetical protein